MIKIFDKNSKLIERGNGLEILKKCYKIAIKQGDIMAKKYYDFCNYLIKNNLKISNDSLLETLSMEFSKDCKIEIYENNKNGLDFWNEYCKYLLTTCDNIYDLVKTIKENDIEICVGKLEDFKEYSTIKEGNFKVSYANNRYYLLK